MEHPILWAWITFLGVAWSVWCLLSKRSWFVKLPVLLIWMLPLSYAGGMIAGYSSYDTTLVLLLVLFLMLLAWWQEAFHNRIISWGYKLREKRDREKAKSTNEE